MDAYIKAQLEELKNVKSLEYDFEKANEKYEAAKGSYRSAVFAEVPTDEDSD